MKSTILIIIPLMVLTACEKNSEPLPTGPVELGLNQKTTEMIQSDNAFGLDLFKEVLSLDATSDNVFVSPTSVALALAMTYNGAEEDTKAEMESAFRKAGLTRDEINTGYKSLMDALLSADERVLLEIANSIWYRQDYTVLPDFIRVNQEYYNADVNEIEFNAEAKDLINQWASDHTHGKIPEILDYVPPDAVMYLVNAIYFKGIWKFEFDQSKTTNMPFNLKDGGQVTVPLMKQTGTFNYFAEEEFSMVELPYGRGNFSMIVMLPVAGHAVDDITAALSQENWDSWMAGLAGRNVVLSLPRFKFEYKNELKAELTAMGMPSAFEPSADFSGINGTGGIYISRVLHKTFVDVNEEGTEAAAVTAVEIVETSYPGSDIVFTVDRPFIFAIRETTTGAILFIGKVQNPLSLINGE